MSNLFTKYETDILEIFKNHYRRLINQSTHLTFEEVLSATCFELQVNQFNDADVSYLKEWFYNVHEFNFLKNLLTPDFFEIIIHSHQKAQLIDKDDKKEVTISHMNQADYELALLVLSLKNNQDWNYKNPFASFNFDFQNFSLRATLIHSSTSSIDCSKLFLRFIKIDSPTLDLFKIDEDLKNSIINIIKDKKNVLISGATASGKTTFMRSLLKEIPQSEHIIVLEDTYEILNQRPNQTSLLSQANTPNKSLKQYCSYALRMSPDRFIIGEMRSHEIVPFILAMNTGHKGLMSTLHANSAVDAIARSALLFSLYSENQDISFNLITKLITKSIDYVIHLEHKDVQEIIRVIGSENETPFYETIYTKACA